MKHLFIAEKPSVAAQFATALGVSAAKKNGYMESDKYVITWCVGHLVTMCYPEKYDAKYKSWRMEDLPFIPENFKYEIISSVASQFKTVSGLLNREDVECIYICTDSGREGEYIYRLVDMMAGVKGKMRLRVWIDSQTNEEILRGIKDAKDWSEYDNLSSAAYLRAKEDYLMGINFSRALTIKYAYSLSSFLNGKRTAISVGRVMTCVLGMVVNREREVREFVKTSFYKIAGSFALRGTNSDASQMISGMKDISIEESSQMTLDVLEKSSRIEAETSVNMYPTLTALWQVSDSSKYVGSPLLYKDIGFREKGHAESFIDELGMVKPYEAIVLRNDKKKEVKKPPLLYNLAELQNACSKRFKISPDQTLACVQELYEKKLVTYPRTDARVLSTAVAKEIEKNIKGLEGYTVLSAYAGEILASGSYKNIAKTKYVDDKQITDHYAIIPTGQGLGALGSLDSTKRGIYEMICRRFLAIFMEPAIYTKQAVEIQVGTESFYANFKLLVEEGYMKVAYVKKDAMSKADEATGKESTVNDDDKKDEDVTSDGEETSASDKLEDIDITEKGTIEFIQSLKKGMKLDIAGFTIKEGETSPPKRYTSGSIILAMENAGQLIEDEDLRSQIKSTGIGTSATRAEILKKLVHIEYLGLNKKTQVITPTLLGEMVYEIVYNSIRSLLNPELTASWEKGLAYVSEGSVSSDEYMQKLSGFVSKNTSKVAGINNQYMIKQAYDRIKKYYQNGGKTYAKPKTTRRNTREKSV